MSSKLKSSKWFFAPSRSRMWILLPISYSIIIQILTGIPKPDALKDAAVHELFIEISEGIFDYPFWLQDLSHFPLFFLFAWLWTWYIRRFQQTIPTLLCTLFITISFAVINELTQFFIPQRFPSVGDIIMNLSGVFSALFLHSICISRMQILITEDPAQN